MWVIKISYPQKQQTRQNIGRVIIGIVMKAPDNVYIVTFRSVTKKNSIQ